MINSQLTEKRARLRKAAQDYQSSLSWYQENLDSPNAEQDCDESSASFKREIGYREMDIIADLLDEIDELQEPRKPLQDKDLQGVIDALEHPAGINAAGKQVVRHALVELQERRKAESEPVGWTDEEELRDVEKSGCGYLFKANPITLHADPRRVILLYRYAQLAPERDQVRSAHAEWSHATFGNVGPVGPLKHLSKEALEAAAEPGDLSEWADMQFLLWDAQRRAGITDEQITQAMIDKLAVNKQREWPEPKDGEPRLHINKSSESTEQ
ncbi:Eaa1 [Klebsiella variicola]|nr:Eaa1 [Klebsiella variicola]